MNKINRLLNVIRIYQDNKIVGLFANTCSFEQYFDRQHGVLSCQYDVVSDNHSLFSKLLKDSFVRLR